MRFSKDLDTHGIALAPEALEAARAAPPLDLLALFYGDDDVDGAARPVELEIGMGKGTFLVQEAPLRPGTCFVGLEYERKVHDYAADRLRRRGLANVRTVCTDAGPFVDELLPAGSLAAVHVYFPDPWPKKRHHKRRLIQAPFVEAVERVLAPGGTLRVVTDHPGYAEHVAEVLGKSRLAEAPYDPPASAGPGELVGTNFERKYRLRDGRPSFAFARRKA